MSTVTTGQTVQVHYVGTFNDGTEFDSSHSRGEPITFQVGAGQMISGFDSAVVGMVAGDSKQIKITPADGYGEVNPAAVQTVPLEAFPEDLELSEGVTVMGQNEMGQQMIAKVISLGDSEAVLDFNHPMAGKELNFSLELISVS
jgi:FKBP-type peptidyl-prolyl cis-trans isomerase 2